MRSTPLWMLLLLACSSTIIRDVVGFTTQSLPHHRRLVPQNLPSTVMELEDSLPVYTNDPTSDDEHTFHKLYSLLHPDTHETDVPVKLQTSRDDTNNYRGIYATREIEEGDVVLRVPLSYCLCDNQPPSWQPSDSWAVRLVSLFLDAYYCDSLEQHQCHTLWWNLLPQPNWLRATLPIHWSDTVLKQAASTALELSNDSRYFTRADAMEQILTSANNKYTADQISYALDIVQTRTCRIEMHGHYVRLLAPLYDCINHSPRANCEFSIDSQQESLTIVALQTIGAGQEITIDYGPSARPAWNCLSSYGFVPTDDPDDDRVAEVFIDGQRFEIGATTIPQDIVAAMDSDATELTPTIATQLSQRLSKVAYSLLLDPWNTKHDKASPEEIVSSQIASTLRFYQHRVLLQCAKGLDEWAQEN